MSNWCWDVSEGVRDVRKDIRVISKGVRNTREGLKNWDVRVYTGYRCQAGG